MSANLFHSSNPPQGRFAHREAIVTIFWIIMDGWIFMDGWMDGWIIIKGWMDDFG